MNETLKSIDGILDIKTSVIDRTVAVHHLSSLPVEDLVVALNSKHLGAILKDVSRVAKGADGGMDWESIANSCQALNQMLLFSGAAWCQAKGFDEVFTRIPLLMCILLSYRLFYKASLAARNMRANVDLMMAVASAGSILQGDLLSAAMVCVLVSVLNVVTLATMRFVDKRLQGCVSIPPSKIPLADGTSVLLSELKIGMVFIVRVGDAIPADGVVTKGRGSVDESRITGEPVPSFKEKGSKVHSGSVLQSGFLEVCADSAVDDSFQSRMLDAVRNAKDTSSATQETVNTFAAWYTPAVVVTAFFIAAAQRNWSQFLVVIVAGCPCALLGAAPFAHAAAIATLAKRHSFLVKETSAFESLAKIRWMGIDKTGTLTTGSFKVLEILTVGKWSEGEVLRWAASVESKDGHPIAQSLVQSYTGCMADFQFSGGLPEVTNFKRQGRCGVLGTVDGHMVGVGNADFLEIEDVKLDSKAAELVPRWSKRGCVLFVIVDEDVSAVILMADAVRGNAKETVEQLSKYGIQLSMLTGDAKNAAEAVADEVGIDDVHSGLLPQDKSDIVLKASWSGKEASALLKRGPRPVGFIGDGLNDCPVLASANVGIVMQDLGTQATVDAASAVLRGDIGHMPAVIVIARRTQRLIMANIFLALMVNVGVIFAAALVGLPLWVSIVADNGGLLLVLLNSLWPLLWRVDPVPLSNEGVLSSTGGNVGFAARGSAS